MDVLKLDHVSKSFGSLDVIRDLSFAVPARSVFGFIGKNGAGKTTTMKMALGFLKPSGGHIEVCGEKVVYGNTRTNRHIGYLPDVPEFYGYMRPKEYLALCGQICGLKPAQIREKTQELLALVGLEGMNRRIQGFSRGMKQRLGIAQALLNEPRLLICDEPTSALDPVGRKEILDILSLISGKTTIVFSTHILSDVERICDTVGILDKGRLVLQDSMAQIRSTYRQDSVRIEFFDPAHVLPLKDGLSGVPFISAIDPGEKSVTVHLKNTADQCPQLLALVSAQGVPIARYEVLEPTLEDVFLEVVE